MLLQVSSVDSSAWGGACRGGRGQGAVSLGLGRRRGVAGGGRAPSRSDWVKVGRQGGCKGGGRGRRLARIARAVRSQSARAFDKPVKYKTLPRSSHYDFLYILSDRTKTRSACW